MVASADPIYIIGPSVSKRTCGTEYQPWILEAPAGQRLRLSLLDFTASTEDSMEGQRKELCPKSGIIVDKSVMRNVSICGGGDHGSKELHMSRGNEVQIILNQIDENAENGDGKRFMIIIAGRITLSPVT